MDLKDIAENVHTIKFIIICLSPVNSRYITC